MPRETQDTPVATGKGDSSHTTTQGRGIDPWAGRLTHKLSTTHAPSKNKKEYIDAYTTSPAVECVGR